ncbi:MAG TPA: aminoacyl-tRNA hydrolase [Ktedonobacteraceae bacterium]|jgi:PTH1 family peptidyl-tRNA hydrolase
MKLIVGLGNPGIQYERTRHNVGFRCVDKLAHKLHLTWERRGLAMIAGGLLDTEKVILVKPLTYMNKSGEAVGELLRWYKLQPEDILVIYDDLDLPLGTIRLRTKGSAGGHNGVENIIHHLHTNQFPRLRIGIGRPTHHRPETIQYVLSIPPLEERIQLETAEERVVEFIPLIVGPDINRAMNIINTNPEKQHQAEEKH